MRNGAAGFHTRGNKKGRAQPLTVFATLEPVFAPTDIALIGESIVLLNQNVHT
jgi:hypothetical protein